MLGLWLGEAATVRFRAMVVFRGPGRLPTWVREWEERGYYATIPKMDAFNIYFRQWYFGTEWDWS
jgi:hypothetical protein